MKRIFNIHGDNIVECERALNLCKESLNLKNAKLLPESTVFCPSYSAENADYSFQFTFFPGYGRWNFDILSLLRTTPESLREAPDVLITEIIEGKEKPLLAIEYCGALPAGNQAWQRSGRGYSTGKSKVPYLYVAELGGYELDTRTREKKAARFPNPAVPFSYLTYTKENSLVLPIYERSPATDSYSQKLYGDIFSTDELHTITKKVLYGEDYSDEEQELENKVLAFIQIKAADSKGTVTLSADEWKTVFDVVQRNESLVNFLCKNKPINWKKTAYIEGLTKSASRFMEIASKYAIGITSSKLSMCIIPKTNKVAFVKEVFALYKDLSADFAKWLAKDENLVITWIMGFKPKGDDARPDRGLAPFARMLCGNDADILTFVYGPAPSESWKTLEENPARLGHTNGLWEAIFSASDALLVDSATANLKVRSFLKSQFLTRKASDKQNEMLVSTLPKKIGENDVDTILHTFMTNVQSLSVFEGMCNPPGGDWSGISLFMPIEKKEYRWLSLPRVSQSGAKRPDHVFELFGIEENPIIFSVESKETAAALEQDIGLHLNRYITDLMQFSVNAERNQNESTWSVSEKMLDENDFHFASAVAYICKSEKDLQIVEAKVKTDVILSYIFDKDGKCKINMTSYSNIGKKIVAALSNAKILERNLSLVKI